MTADRNACRRCGGEMRPGIAMGQTYTAGAPDFPGDREGSTMSAGGPGRGDRGAKVRRLRMECDRR